MRKTLVLTLTSLPSTFAVPISYFETTYSRDWSAK